MRPRAGAPGRRGAGAGRGSFFEENLRGLTQRPAPEPRPVPDHQRHTMEARLARLLERAGLSGFRRRVHVGPYEVDFLFPSRRLVVELDGFVHLAADVQARDRRKEGYLTALGYRVLHVANSEVVAAPDQVLQRIRRALGADGRRRG